MASRGRGGWQYRQTAGLRRAGCPCGAPPRPSLPASPRASRSVGPGTRPPSAGCPAAGRRSLSSRRTASSGWRTGPRTDGAAGPGPQTELTETGGLWTAPTAIRGPQTTGPTRTRGRQTGLTRTAGPETSLTETAGPAETAGRSEIVGPGSDPSWTSLLRTTGSRETIGPAGSAVGLPRTVG